MEVPQPLQRNAALVEGALRTLFTETSFPLCDLMEYHLSWRDQTGAPLEDPSPPIRIHANLCLLACQALGGDPEKALPAAGAVELVEQFAQVHADIQDGNHLRHNRPTVWKIWGLAQAINAGDGLHAMGRLSQMWLRVPDAAPDETLQSVRTLDASCLRMCQGLHQDLLYRDQGDITPDEYLTMAREKVGALLGCALELGAIAAEAPAAAGQAFRRFGEDLGVAFQVQEDIQALWGEPLSGRATGADVLVKRKLFPVVHALDRATPRKKRDLAKLLSGPVLEPSHLEALRNLLDGLDAGASARQVARRLCGEAIDHLAEIGLVLSDGEGLRQVARWLAIRQETA